MSRHVTIDPITRLEGHGKIDIFLDDDGEVSRAYFQVPELRGFEKFVQGRPVEDMPQITSRICGVCPTAHHMAAAKALDDLYQIEPPPAARRIRELVYNTFVFEDHALHFYFLGGPDFLVGPDAPKAQRNILGVAEKLGLEIVNRVIAMRRDAREMIAQTGGKVIHPVLGLPGGVAKPITPEQQQRWIELAERAVQFSLFTLQVFNDVVLNDPDYMKLVSSDAYVHRTYYMGLVDESNNVNFYDGMLRVVDPRGKQWRKFPARDYLKHVAEHVEPWSYVKFCYLKDIGWKGFQEGRQSGVYAVAPLARLNAAEGMPTPRAQDAYEEFFATLGAKPVHYTLATHWARLVEMLCAAEMMDKAARDPDLTNPDVRAIPTAKPSEGTGVVEAPRGVLVHHYQTDERGLVQKANLIVATQNNAARIAMSVDRAAKAMIHHGKVDDGLLNRVEMAFRAYDPCNGCATHALPGQLPLALRLYDSQGELLREIRRG